MLRIKWRMWTGEWLIKEFDHADAAYYSFIWVCAYCGYKYKILNTGG